MRCIELRTELPSDAAQAWRSFVDTAQWPRWGGLVHAAKGRLTPGERWTIVLRADREGATPRTMRPTLLEVDEGRRLLFETIVGARGLVRMTHAFVIEPTPSGHACLRQSFEATGMLVVPLWRWLEPGMRQFDELGRDLARALAEDAQ